MQQTTDGLRLAFTQYDGALNMEVGLDPDSHASTSFKQAAFRNVLGDYQAYVTAYRQDGREMHGTGLSARLKTVGVNFSRYQTLSAQVMQDMQHHQYQSALYLQDVGNATVTEAMNMALSRLNAEVGVWKKTQEEDLQRRMGQLTELVTVVGLIVMGTTALGLVSFRRSTGTLVKKLEAVSQGRFGETEIPELWKDYLPVHRAFGEMRQALSDALMTLVTIIQNQETLIASRTKAAQQTAAGMQAVLEFITETMQDWHREDIFSLISREFLHSIQARGWVSFNALSFERNAQGGIVPEIFVRIPDQLRETLESKNTPLPLILPGEPLEGRVYSWRPYNLGRSFLVIFYDVTSSKGGVEWMIVELAITQLQNMWSEVWLFQETERQAKQDSLTQLGNRRMFETRLQAKICPDSQDSAPFQLMLIDVDHLKTINDTQGHQAGDEALKNVADALKQVTGETVEAFRIGGDEFALLLDGREDYVRPDDVMLRIQMNLPQNLTLSFGVAQSPTMGLSPRVLFMTADWALYEAKKHGRHQLYFARLVDMLGSLGQGRESETAKVIAAWLDDRLRWPQDTTLTTAQAALTLGKELGLSSEDQQCLWIAAILHDLGRLLEKSVADHPTEFEQAQEFGIIAADFLDPFPDLTRVATAVRCQKERWDGLRSFHNLKGADIPLFSRIIAVVDHVFWIRRELKPTSPQDIQDINDILEAEAGTCLDPYLVSLWIRKNASW